MIPQEWLDHAPKPRRLLKGKKWHVFLSYRSVNRAWVLNLYDVLTELGFKVFLDQYVLKAGATLARTLEEGLEKSMAGVLVWSNAAKDSEWVKDEYYVMDAKTKNDKPFHFVPIRIEHTKLPAFADTKLFLDFTDYPDGPNGGELLRLVYGIVGQTLNRPAVKFATQQDEAASKAADQITAAIINDQPKKLQKLFQEGGLPWETTASLACKAAEGLVKLGKENDAIEMLSQIEAQFPKSIRPKQLKALALARRGKGDDLNDAQEILGELYASKHMDPETLGLYARTFMDRYKLSGKTADLRKSRKYYQEAFEKSPDDFYTGINAAAKSIFLGDYDTGLDLSKKVKKLLDPKTISEDYWKTATLAEVLLIQKDFKKAADMYQKAVNIAPTEIASHQSTQMQAILLAEKLTVNPNEINMIRNAFSLN